MLAGKKKSLGKNATVSILMEKLPLFYLNFLGGDKELMGSFKDHDAAK